MLDKVPDINNKGPKCPPDRDTEMTLIKSTTIYVTAEGATVSSSIVLSLLSYWLSFETFLIRSYSAAFGNVPTNY